jgi:hypothetical protein
MPINIRSDSSYVISLKSNPKEPQTMHPLSSSHAKKISNTIIGLLFTAPETATPSLSFSLYFISQSYPSIILLKTPYFPTFSHQDPNRYLS